MNIKGFIKLIAGGSQIFATTGLGMLVSTLFFQYENGCLDHNSNLNRLFFFGSVFLVLGILSQILIESKKNQALFKYLVFMVSRYLLAYVLFVHAIPQIYGMEFSSSYFSLDEKLVNYSPRQFAYLFYAYNPAYQKVFGWIMLISASALCFRFTSLIASLILIPYFGNVFLTNYMFETCHLLDSGIIIVSLLSILTYYAKRILDISILNRSSRKLVYPLFESTHKHYISANLLKLILIVGYLSFLNNKSFDRKQSWWNIESPLIQGVWQIDTIESGKDAIPRFEKFFFEKGRRGIVTVKDDTISGFQYIIDTSYNQLEFWNFHVYRDLDFKGKYNLIGQDTMEYTGTNQKDSVYILLSRIQDYDKLKELE